MDVVVVVGVVRRRRCRRCHRRRRWRCRRRRWRRHCRRRRRQSNWFVCVCVCKFGQQPSKLMTFDLDIWHWFTLSEFCARNKNSAHVTCKFCAPLWWILCSRFFHFKIISGIAVRPCLPHYTMSGKMEPLFLSLTLPNDNWFSKFFHRWIWQ